MYEKKVYAPFKHDEHDARSLTKGIGEVRGGALWTGVLNVED